MSHWSVGSLAGGTVQLRAGSLCSCLWTVVCTAGRVADRRCRHLRDRIVRISFGFGPAPGRPVTSSSRRACGRSRCLPRRGVCRGRRTGPSGRAGAGWPAGRGPAPPGRPRPIVGAGRLPGLGRAGGGARRPRPAVGGRGRCRSRRSLFGTVRRPRSTGLGPGRGGPRSGVRSAGASPRSRPSGRTRSGSRPRAGSPGGSRPG